jgi:endoglucanase
LNQVGYVVGHPKFAISLDATATGSLLDSATGQSVFQASLAPAVRWTAAGDTGHIFDFTSFNQPGTYYLQVGGQQSHPIHISADPYLTLSRGSIKAYWFTRCSYAPQSPWAGAWARAAGHPDLAVVVHGSAATAARPEGSTIRSPGGWYDAGDYGKYVVNSGISTWTLLHLYESAPAFFDTLSLNVPTHGGPKSDLVDEILWNLRWMLTMQDPNDGGVYHKLTTADFSTFGTATTRAGMPANDKATRYVVQKSTAATLDLAAVAAYAARLFRGNSELPGFADSCQSVALAAWNWARANPDSLYDQDSVNAYYSPAINTGTYGDGKVSDEFDWAASELFLTTGSDSFAVVDSLPAKLATPATWSWPGWSEVQTSGLVLARAWATDGTSAGASILLP